MNGFFSALLLALGLGGLAYGVKKIVDAVEGPAKKVGEAAGAAYDAAATQVKKVGKAVTEAKETLKKQSKQSSRERAGEGKPGDSWITGQVDKWAKDKGLDRESQDSRADSREKSDKAATLAEYRQALKTAESLGAPGVELWGDVYLTVEELRRRIALLGG